MATRERIELTSIDDNPWQPRQEIDPEMLAKLADSIHQVGLLQMPRGRPHPEVSGRIQLAYGHRRIAAVRLLHEQGKGPSYVDMEVDGISDEHMAVMALTENVARARLSQIEVVRAHRRALDETELSIQSLADQLSVSRSALSNNLRVLELPDFVLEHVESGALSVSVAREFLVLQNADHCHAEDMQAVINGIVKAYRVVYQGEPPNWSRRNVRQLIATQVSSNEADFRPLGPYSGGTAGAARKATFDVAAFSSEFTDTLHTIPAPVVKNERPGAYDGHESVYSGSRVWTCEVKEWRRRQTQASREANKQAEVSGTKTNAGGSSAPSSDKQFEQALAKDPVWKGIVARREKKGPNRPITDEERAALGTRAELKSVDPYGDVFWKILENGRPENVHDWERDRSGGRVPPFFKLADCTSCVAGAAYAKSRHDYTGDGVKFVCTNGSCYDRKLAGDEAVHREKVEAELMGADGQDGATIKVIMGRLALLTRKDLRTLVSSLIAAQPELALTHTMGVPHQKWSYQSMTVRFVTGLLTHKPAHFERYARTDEGVVVLDLESLDEVPDGDLLELAASLMTYHLRQAGKLPAVSRETATPPPDPLEVRELLTGEKTATEAQS